MTPQTVQRVRVRPRSGARIAVLAALPILGLAACDEDPFVFRWNATPDTVLLYSLDRPEPNLPSGFGFLERALVRVETPGSTGVWDVALDTDGGSLVLNLFGISIAALRIAGGLVVSLWAWSILSAPEVREERKRDEAAPAAEGDDVAFFPLTLPFTTGPGTIAVAIALGSSRPAGADALAAYVLGATAATLAMAASKKLQGASSGGSASAWVRRIARTRSTRSRSA